MVEHPLLDALVRHSLHGNMMGEDLDVLLRTGRAAVGLQRALQDALDLPQLLFPIVHQRRLLLLLGLLLYRLLLGLLRLRLRLLWLWLWLRGQLELVRRDAGGRVLLVQYVLMLVQVLMLMLVVLLMEVLLLLQLLLVLLMMGSTAAGSGGHHVLRRVRPDLLLLLQMGMLRVTPGRRLLGDGSAEGRSECGMLRLHELLRRVAKVGRHPGRVPVAAVASVARSLGGQVRDLEDLEHGLFVFG
jgi:hypothetical protein